MKTFGASLIFLGRWIGILLLVSAVLAAPLGVIELTHRMGAGFDVGLSVAEMIYSWPVIVGGCVVLFLLLFREPVGAFIRGMRRFRAGGVEIEREQSALPETGRDPRKDEISWEEWFLELGSKLSPVDREVIAKLGQIQQQAFVQWIRRWWFEKIWGQIYGTQVLLVQMLANQKDSDNIALTYAAVAYERHLEARSASTPEEPGFFKKEENKVAYFTRWLGFLEDAHLVEVGDKVIKKTPLTNEFVQYLQSQGYSMHLRIW